MFLIAVGLIFFLIARDNVKMRKQDWFLLITELSFSGVLIIFWNYHSGGN